MLESNVNEMKNLLDFLFQQVLTVIQKEKKAI